MRIIITGGPGMVGTPLANHLSRDGHEVIFLSRNPERVARSLQKGQRVERWDARTAAGWAHLADGADAIVNLAAQVIANPNPFKARWTAARRRRILESRKNSGRAVVEAVKAATSKPKVVVQASAVGYYGLRGDEIVTEAAQPGDDFLARVCVEWENSTAPVEEMGVRRAIARTGLLLSTRDGFLPPVLLSFKLFTGGTIGNGRQFWPWIHMDDEVGALRFLIESGASGAFNLSAPNPVTNREFGKVVGRVMRRPAYFPVPAFGMRLVYGELADLLLLGGQRTVPEALELHGFQFKYRDLEPALRDTLRK
jgi:uncharacterized protein